MKTNGLAARIEQAQQFEDIQAQRRIAAELGMTEGLALYEARHGLDDELHPRDAGWLDGPPVVAGGQGRDSVDMTVNARACLALMGVAVAALIVWALIALIAKV